MTGANRCKGPRNGKNVRGLTVSVQDSRWLSTMMGAVVVGMLVCADANGAEGVAKSDAGKTLCGSLTSLQLPALNAHVLHAALVPAGPAPSLPFGPRFQTTLPAYGRADGVIDERRGHDGRAYSIEFAVAMTENWNGRFLMQGGGGLDDSVGAPVGSVAAGARPALARGFSVVTTDSGHSADVAFDTSFLADQEATLNFLYQAVGKVAQVGKEVVAAHYGRRARHSYFMGCSTGGREAMLMAQRYPRYFNGIVVGAPAMRTSFSNLADKWITVALNQVAPKDEQARPEAAHV